jgi:hypothetical protein
MNSTPAAHIGRKRRPNWVPVAWGIAGPPCPVVCKYGGTTLQVWGWQTTFHRKKAARGKKPWPRNSLSGIDLGSGKGLMR